MSKEIPERLNFNAETVEKLSGLIQQAAMKIQLVECGGASPIEITAALALLVGRYAGTTSVMMGELANDPQYGAAVDAALSAGLRAGLDQSKEMIMKGLANGTVERIIDAA